MECHRCGRTGTLTRYTLDGRRAVVCGACGFVGIPADHGRSAPPGDESWTEALDRVTTDEAVGAAVTVSDAPPVVEGGEPPPTLGDVAGVSVAAGLRGGLDDPDDPKNPDALDGRDEDDPADAGDVNESSEESDAGGDVPGDHRARGGNAGDTESADAGSQGSEDGEREGDDAGGDRTADG